MRSYFYYVFSYTVEAGDKSVQFDVAERIDGSNNLCAVMKRKVKLDLMGLALSLDSVSPFKTMKEAEAVARRNNDTYKTDGRDLYSNAVQVAEDDAICSVLLQHYDQLRMECQHLGVNLPDFSDEEDRKMWLRENLESVKACIYGSVSLAEIKDEVESLIHG